MTQDTHGLSLEGPQYSNSLGQRFVRIDPGTFSMGVGDTPLPEDVAEKPHRSRGDYDERPEHEVELTRPFYMGVCQVTNAEYEQFDPDHRALRGRLGLSKEDDEAVVFVSWHDAARFCDWLSKKDGLPYRLPTEAEWEYACRAGTRTHYHTGDHLPDVFLKNARRSWFPDPERTEPGDVVSLTVGKTPPNAWGLCDMHGNVEEWCYDWYGPYEPGKQTDPIGRVAGDFRVTRGGSHSAEVYYLRSANRMGALADESSWLIGFRVVIAPLPNTAPLPVAERPLAQCFVEQHVPPDLKVAPDTDVPYFRGPNTFVKIPPESNGPMYSHHNHVPSIAECPNGDLLAVWYSCNEESGRECAFLASRLRYGQCEWEPASPHWDVPDRTQATVALWYDGAGTLHEFTGLSAAATWGNLCIVLRTSSDSGASWTALRVIVPEHGIRHMPIPSIFRAINGAIVLPCDAVTGGHGGTALWMSEDDGASWFDAGGTIAGIHAGVTQLPDGRLLAFGRGDEIDGMMPMSVSEDMGKSWRRSPSVFPPIHGGQRLVLRRLQEGPLFFASYANEPMMITDASGAERPIEHLFCALSLDDGQTWPFRRLVSDDYPEHAMESMDGYSLPMSKSTSEHAGYLASCQAANGLIHLISSRAHYAFNLAWLKSPPPAL